MAALTGLPPRRRWPPGRWMSVAPRWAAARSTKGYLHDPRHHLLHRDRLPRPADGERGDALCHHTEAGQVISLFPMQAGMPNIDWLQQHISLDADLGRLEQRSRRWSQAAAASSGSRTSMANVRRLQPGRAAGFFGISPHTTRAELQRAVFEGLAFAIVDALQGYPQGGELYLTGGGAASATWLQIIADCTGRTVVSSAFNELSARGAAILAARSVAALAETPPLAQTRYQPRPQAHARYAALYPVYRCCASRCCRYGRPDRPPFNLFLRTYNHEIVFTAEHAGDLSAFHQLGELLVEGGRWANRNSAPVS
ncbi:carbohydrate kinase, FGGY family [Klebsiella pneumoniae]|nr:carbohydrate kinase, FGGY family [Klebsiella pneumoniae]